MFTGSLLLTVLPWLIFIQGILLSLIVLSKIRFKSNSYLGLFLILLSFHGLVSLLWLNPEGRSLAEIYVAAGVFPFLYGPLIYRYVWHSLYRDVNDSISFAIHSIPGILYFIFYLVFYMIIGRTRFLQIAENVLDGHGPLFVSFIEWAKIIHGILYCILIIRMLFRHRAALKKTAFNRKHKSWLITLISLFSINWLLVLISGILLWTGHFSDDVNMLVSGLQLTAFLAFIYTLVFFALRFPVILEPTAVREEIRRKLNLPSGFIQETLKRLEEAERNKFYTDTEVTLSSLASSLGLHPNALSFIINETKEKGFREYLNHLRIEDFLSRFERAEERTSFLSLAFDAGFASKSTFLRAFRAEYSMTPQEFLKNRGVKTHT